MEKELLKHQSRLMSFAVALTGNVDSASDLLQETSLRALLYKDKYKVGSNAKAWLFTIMKNTYINKYRLARKRKTHLDYSKDNFFIESNCVNKPLSPEKIINENELRQVIKRLPGIARLPFEFYLDGYQYEEIAEMMELPLGTVKSRIYQARQMLKATVNRY
jgi:RNA polymerase sigma-70 factor (ECF subfamily)